MLNKLLQRQIRKALDGKEEIPEQLLPLLLSISESYDHYEKDRKMLERSIELSSDEMIGLYKTLKKESEEPLEANELKFRSLIQNTSDVIYVVDRHFKITFASDSAERITGFSPTELIGNSGTERLHPDDILKAMSDFREVIQNPGGSKVIVRRILKKDGSYIWVEGMVTNLLEDPTVRGIVCNFRDISERKKTEEILETNIAEIKKTNSELDHFVYSVSHDLRAPLCSILGITELTEDSTNDPMVLKHLGMIKSSVEKLDGFIRDILDYSRNSRLELKGENINLEGLVREVATNLKHMNRDDREVDIRINLDEKSPFCSDKNRIFVVINNLISNAFRYQNPDVTDPFLSVSMDVSNSEANIQVSDNGIGIDEIYHEKIFNMFFRVSEKSVGSGLGLYLVKETINKLKGKIRVESSPGRGSSFFVSIPNNLPSLQAEEIN